MSAGKFEKLLEAAKLGDADEVRTLMSNGTRLFRTEWVNVMIHQVCFVENALCVQILFQ